jgi:hypothetical protein
MSSRRRWALFLTGAIALVTGSVAAKLPETKPQCEIAREWAEANLGRLPTTLEDLSKYSLVYRRAIYTLLAPAVQRDLWRAHLASFMSSTSTLNVSQRAIVAEAITNMDQYLADTAKTEAFRRRVLTVFTIEQGKPIFGTLGPVGIGGVSPGPATTTPDVACECEVGDSWCFLEWCNDSETCTRGSGCGTFWTGPCNGMCGNVSRP